MYVCCMSMSVCVCVMCMYVCMCHDDDDDDAAMMIAPAFWYLVSSYESDYSYCPYSDRSSK